MTQTNTAKFISNPKSPLGKSRPSGHRASSARQGDLARRESQAAGASQYYPGLGPSAEERHPTPHPLLCFCTRLHNDASSFFFALAAVSEIDKSFTKLGGK